MWTAVPHGVDERRADADTPLLPCSATVICAGRRVGRSRQTDHEHHGGDRRHGGGTEGEALAAPLPVAPGVGGQAAEDGGLELERHVVPAQVAGVGGRQDPGQRGQVGAFVPAFLTTVEMGAQGQAIPVVQLTDDLHGEQAVPVVATVAGH